MAIGVVAGGEKFVFEGKGAIVKEGTAIWESPQEDANCVVPI